MYMFVTVCIFEKRSTTYITRVFPRRPTMHTIEYRIWLTSGTIGKSAPQFGTTESVKFDAFSGQSMNENVLFIVLLFLLYSLLRDPQLKLSILFLSFFQIFHDFFIAFIFFIYFLLFASPRLLITFERRRVIWKSRFESIRTKLVKFRLDFRFFFHLQYSRLFSTICLADRRGCSSIHEPE